MLPGAPSERMDKEVWARTRCLVAPSLWPEPFGLVAVEAALRAIPALTTDLAGLREANVVADHVVPTDLVHDVEIGKTYRAPPTEGRSSLGTYEAQRGDLARSFLDPSAPRGPVDAVEATDADVRALAAKFAAKLGPLMGADAAPLRRASERSYDAAWAHLRDRRHAMPRLFRGLRD